MSSKNFILKECLKQNIKLIDLKLSFQNFGNLSLRLDSDHFAIKPSGANLKTVKYSEFPIVNIKNGKKISGNLKPSSDTKVHLEIYKHFSKINGVAHTHSFYATAWAQSCRPINILGTTHSDFSNKNIPITKKLLRNEILNDYEKAIGLSIIKSLKENNISAYNSPGILVANHGPFAWGKTAEDTIKNIEAIEIIAKLAFLTENLNPKKMINEILIKKHFERKHGINSYYGQK
tara:strand:+ start:3069 stop:3767 length:699 start_codon:yes stop_codon:yes gene_type:complete